MADIRADEWWDALIINRHHEVIPVWALRCLDAAERATQVRTGFNPSLYVRHTEYPGVTPRAERLDWLIKAGVLAALDQAAAEGVIGWRWMRSAGESTEESGTEQQRGEDHG